MATDLSYEIRKATQAAKNGNNSSLAYLNQLYHLQCENLEEKYKTQLTEQQRLEERITQVERKNMGYNKLSLNYVRIEVILRYVVRLLVSIVISVVLLGISVWVTNTIFSNWGKSVIVGVLWVGVIVWVLNSLTDIVTKFNKRFHIWNDKTALEEYRNIKMESLIEVEEKRKKTTQKQRREKKKRKK